MLYLKNLIYLDVLLLAALFCFREALQPRHRKIIDPKLFLLVAAIPAAGLLGGNIWIFYAFLFAAVAFAPRTRAEVGSIYLLVLPSVPLMTTLFEPAAFELSSLLFMNLGAVVGLVIWKGPVAGRRMGLDLAVVLLILLFSFIDARGTSLTHWARTLISNGLLFGVPYLVISSAIVSEKHLLRALLTFAASGFAIAAVGAFEALRRWSLYQTFHAALDVPLPMLAMDLNVRGGLLRAPGPFLDPTIFGLFLAVLVILLICMRRVFRPQLSLVVLGVAALALLTTQSRGAWVAAIAAYLAVIWFRGRTLTMAATAAAGMLLVVAAGLALPAYEEPVTPNMWGQAESTTDYRARLLDRGSEEFARNPWTGLPEEQVRIRLVDLTQGQGIIDFVNSHLYIALTAGAVGLIVWFGYLLAPILMLWARRSALRHRRMMDVAAAVVGVNVATAAALAFTSLIDRNCVWMLVFAGFLPVMLNPRRQRTLVAARSAPPGAGEIVTVPGIAPATPGTRRRPDSRAA